MWDLGHIDRDVDSITSRNRDVAHSYFMTNMPWTSGNAQKSLGTSRSPAFLLGVLSGPVFFLAIFKKVLKKFLVPFS